MQRVVGVLQKRIGDVGFVNRAGDRRGLRRGGRSRKALWITLLDYFEQVSRYVGERCEGVDGQEDGVDAMFEADGEINIVWDVARL